VNAAKTAAYLLLPLMVTAIRAGQVWGQSRAPETTMRRSVPPDTETKVGSAVRYHIQANGQCSTWYIPVLELVTPPRHGTVSADIGVPSGSGCSSSVNGQAVMYRPDPGVVDRDRFTYNSPGEPMAFDVIGRPGPMTVIVTVVGKN